MTPAEELTHAVRLAHLLRDNPNVSPLVAEKWDIVADWLDLEAEVLACRTPKDPEIVSMLPSVRMARLLNSQWVIAQ